MDFEFYNYTSPPAGVRRLLIPMQRVLRRILRPMFHRLRDLLTLVYQRQDEDRRQIDHLTHRVAHLEVQLQQAAAARRAFQLDYVALTRRVAQLEDLLLQSMADRHHDPLDGLLPMDAEPATNGKLRRAS